MDEWLKSFPTTLRSIAIDWYTNLEAAKKTTWKDIHTAFEEEFRLLQHNDEMVIEIYNTWQEKIESVRAYSSILKE